MLAELDPVDLTGAGPVQLLRFWLAQERPPAAAESLEMESGALINAIPPGYWELALVNEQLPGWWHIFYWIPAGQGNYFIVSSWGNYFDHVYEVMKGRDFGEAMTEAVKTGWPLFFSCLLDGYRRDLKSGALMRFQTTGIQWGLTRGVGGIEVRRREDIFEGYGAEHFGKLQHLSLDLLKETHKGLEYMPGYLNALGTDDYATRRLKRVDSTLKEVLDVVELAAKLLGG